jgi:hypothetical protein
VTAEVVAQAGGELRLARALVEGCQALGDGGIGLCPAINRPQVLRP